MYPLSAILLGCNENEISELRREFENLAVGIEASGQTVGEAFGTRTPVVPDSCFFLVRVRGPEDLESMRPLVRAHAGKPILGLMNSDSNTGAILQTLRAGAAQIALYPLISEDLQNALETLAVQFGFETNTAKVIAVSGVTEGCGATSLAINLGFEMSRIHKRRCILAELSVHCGRLAIDMNLDPPLSIYDLLTGSGPLDIGTIKQALVKTANELQVLAGPTNAIGTTTIASSRVSELIGHLKQMADVVLLDLPSVFNDAYFEVLSRTDRVVLVGQQSVPSIHDLKLVKEAINQHGCLARNLVVISHFDSNDSDFSYDHLVDVLGVDDLHTVRTDSAGFRQCLNNGTPLYQSAARSLALTDIQEIAESLLTPRQNQVPHKCRPAKRHWFSRLLG